MRADWPSSPVGDHQRGITVTSYTGGAWADLVGCTIGAGTDLSPFITRLSHGPNQCKFSAAWHSALDTIPIAGDLIQIKDGSRILWNGAIEQVDERREKRGARTMSVTARSRDASPQWRLTEWVTDTYPVGTDLGTIVEDVLTALGLESHEFPEIGAMGRSTPHSSMQLAGLSAWAMLETLLIPLGLQPFVDAVGRFKPISRDVTRIEDIELTKADVLSISGGKSRQPVTNVVVKWLDRMLSKSIQQDQKLASEQMTIGYFAPVINRRVYWSDDRRQRAEDTRLVIVDSANAGLLPVATEAYSEESETSGRITLTSTVWAPALAAGSLAAYLYWNFKTDTALLGGGPVIPTARAPQAAAAAGIMFVMMHIGNGQYEVWGKPFDWVHAMNKTEAYDDAALAHRRNEVQIESDFIYDEEHARGLAISELLYRAREGQDYTVEIVDSGAIEPGDILKLPGGSRLYVTSYQRQLTRGVPATLTVQGFRV